jgi:hypothetical protein
MNKEQTSSGLRDAACCAVDFDGWPFVVTIDRNRMERRYVLRTVDTTDGLMAARNDPMTGEEFREHYGFSEEFPHEFIQHNAQGDLQSPDKKS